MSVELEIRCLGFSREALVAEIAKASRGDPSVTEGIAQVRYLGSYLSHRDSGAKSMVVEHPYVDRHYLEEYTGYYANTFDPPPPKATRIHFFTRELTDEGLAKKLQEASSGGFQNARASLQDAYLGFVVVRPLASAPIGRTTLRPFSGVEDRNFGPPILPHSVHLAGIPLKVDGIPFQQQDRAVGACATAAVWSALARTIRADGGRAPTPLAVTVAATGRKITGRVLPAEDGLDVEQICASIHDFGYSPFLLKAAFEPEQALMALKCYLRSGIPVVLHLGLTEEGHAVTAVGFRESDAEDDPPAIEMELTPSHRLVTKGISRLYVHDDRLGPYARMRVRLEARPEATAAAGGAGRRNLELRVQAWPYEAGFEKFETSGTVWALIAPLYPKLRLSAAHLLASAGELLPPLKSCLTEVEREQLRVDTWFQHGSDYLKSLMSAPAGVSPDRIARLARRAWPRYVGLIRFGLGKRPLVDMVCDTTDIPRDDVSPLLVVLPYRQADIDRLRDVLSVGPSRKAFFG